MYNSTGTPGKLSSNEKSDKNASAEDRKTKNLFGFEVNLARHHGPDIDNLPFDKNSTQIVQQGHPLAKRPPL